MQLTSGRLLASNSIWNLVGLGLPMVVALFTIPALLEHLGTDKFGILLLAWMFVGYFSFFDLGLGRALTKLVAERRGSEPQTEMAALVGTAIVLMAVLGLGGAIVAAVGGSYALKHLLTVPLALERDTLNSLYLLSASVPIVVLTAAFRGLLEGYQRFGLINAVRIPLGVFTYAGPLLVLPYSESILAVILVLVAARVMACLVYVVLIIRTFPGLRRRLETRRESIVPLMTFGGWLTVSNVVGPVLLYADRFVIAAEMTLTDVAYYATPFEVIIKLLIIPTAILGVVFPAFSEANARNKTRLAFLYARTIGYLLLVHVPIVAIVVVCAGTGLAYWINAEFASHSTHAAQILAVGVLINGVGLVSQALVQSAGRADWTAKLHLLELPIYIGYLYVLVSSYGIVGAASAWLIRVTLSTLVLSLMAIRVIAVKQPIGTESNGR